MQRIWWLSLALLGCNGLDGILVPEFNSLSELTPDGDPTDTAQDPVDSAAPGPTDTPEPTDEPEPTDPPAPPPYYLSTVGPYETGPVTVDIEVWTAGNGTPITLYKPTTVSDSQYPVVLFLHGFLLNRNWYRDTLEHIASHGFLVIAPQMHAADSNPIGKPTSRQDGAKAAQAMQASLNYLSASTSYATGRLAIVGHSRGAKSAWAIANSGNLNITAMAGIDPVDSGGSFIAPDPYVTPENGSLSWSHPTFLLGAELGSEALNFLTPACAPENDNYSRFQDASVSDVWSYFVPDYGHLDMLDTDANCGLTCAACTSGPDDGGMVDLNRGLLTAFLRKTLSLDTTVDDELSGDDAPIDVDVSTTP